MLRIRAHCAWAQVGSKSRHNRTDQSMSHLTSCMSSTMNCQFYMLQVMVDQSEGGLGGTTGGRFNKWCSQPLTTVLDQVEMNLKPHETHLPEWLIMDQEWHTMVPEWIAMVPEWLMLPEWLTVKYAVTCFQELGDLSITVEFQDIMDILIKSAETPLSFPLLACQTLIKSLAAWGIS